MCDPRLHEVSVFGTKHSATGHRTDGAPDGSGVSRAVASSNLQSPSGRGTRFGSTALTPGLDFSLPAAQHKAFSWSTLHVQSVKRKKKIRRIIYGAVALLAIIVVSVGVSGSSRRRPAWTAPRSGSTPSSAGRCCGRCAAPARWCPRTSAGSPRTTQGRVERILLQARRAGEAGHGHPRAEQPRPRSSRSRTRSSPSSRRRRRS